uniref:Histone deacetylase 14 n=1 Tax=Tanacetum cinerariifolium TaxID=118510 RepID=A0A6L2MM87_TANCI|nr:hypothetical protein [Tanacetum cinerariifolium]
MKSIQTFLEEFNYIPYGEKPKIFLQAWDKKFSIQYAQLEDSNELFQKLLEDLQIINKELAKYINSPSRDRPIFFDDNEDHSVQYKEYLENSSNEIAASNSNQEKEKPPQDFDIRQLIREECCIEVCEDQKQNMENTILELVEICHQKELYCMHDNVDDLIESTLNSKLLSINLISQHLDKKKQEVKNVVEQPAERRTRIEKSLQNFRVIHTSSTSLKNKSQISPVHALAPILSTKEPEYSPSMGYEHTNTTLEMESDEIIKSGVEELVPILSECEVTSEDKKECDVPVCENSPICDDRSEIFFDSNNDDDISSDDDDFEDIEYVKASLPDLEIVSVEEENVVYQEEEEVDLEDIFQIQDVVLHEKLLSINRLIADIESLNDNPTPDRVLNSFVSFPISEESDNSLSDNFSPEFKTFCDHTKETRSGNTTTHADNYLPDDPLLEEADLFLASDNLIPPGIENFAYDSEGDIRFLEALLIDDTFPFPKNEASDFDNLSFSRPPLEPPDAEFDFEKEISVMMNDSDELECFDPRDEFNVSNNENDDYFSFMFVIRIFLPDLIYSKMFLSFLSAESEDTIFNPGPASQQMGGCRKKQLLFGCRKVTEQSNLQDCCGYSEAHQLLQSLHCFLDNSITPVNNNNPFSSPPTPDALINFVNNLGYPKVVRALEDVGRTHPIHTFLHRRQKESGTAYSGKEESQSPCDPKYQFRAKGTKWEVFGMPIPNKLITTDIQGEQYYKEYLEKVAKHQRYLASEEGSDLDSPAPKPAKATKKSKPLAPKADLRPPVIKTALSQQPKPKPAPAKSQEKKRKLVTETFDKPSPAKRSKPGLVTKRRKPTSSLRSVDEFVNEVIPKKKPRFYDEEAVIQRAVEESLKSVHDAPQGPLLPVVIREPDFGKFQPLPEVQGKGKEKVSDEQVAHDLLTLQTPKKVSHVEQYIFQRRTPASTEPLGHAESPSIYTALGLTKSDSKSDEEVPPMVEVGAPDEGQAGPNSGVLTEGQAGSDPGDDAEPQP